MEREDKNGLIAAMHTLRIAEVPEEEILKCIQLMKSDLGPDLAALGLAKGYKIIPYGSAVTGLFTKDSDFDFFIRCNPQPASKAVGLPLVRRLCEVMKQRKRDDKPLYKDIVTMTNGRVPVLKCVHTALNREININFTSPNGVNNSLMIQHLLSLDGRIKPIMMFLKTYFRQQQCQVTTFNLYSLIIFALQNTKDHPVLPPLNYFLDKSKEALEPAVLVDNRWPAKFHRKPFSTKNNQTIIQLIIHFCGFYADLQNRLVSPYMGNQVTVTKVNYRSFEEFKCSDHWFKFNRAINIQDFFVLCINQGSYCKKFKNICKAHNNHRVEYERMSDQEFCDKFFDRIIQ